MVGRREGRVENEVLRLYRQRFIFGEKAGSCVY